MDKLEEAGLSDELADRDSRQQKANALREIFAKSRESIYQLAEDLYDKIASDIECSDSDIFKFVEEHIGKAGLSPEQIKELEYGINRLLKARNRVIDIKSEGLSGEEIYQEATGMKCNGAIRVEYTPTSINLFCEDEGDLRNAFMATQGSSITDEDAKVKLESLIAFSDSVNAKNQIPPKYQALMIFLGPDATREVYEHEIDHSKASIYSSSEYADQEQMDKIDAKRSTDKHIAEFAKKSDGDPSKFATLLFRDEIKDFSPFIQLKIAREISGYYIQGIEPDEIREALDHPLYFDSYISTQLDQDFIKMLHYNFDKYFYGESIPSMIELVSQLTEEGKQILKGYTDKILAAIMVLESKGYDRKRICTIIRLEAPEDLGRVASRLPVAPDKE